MQSPLREVQHILATMLEVDAASIEPDSIVRDLPNVDSARVLEGVVQIEDHFGVELPESIVLGLARVVDIADAVTEALVARDRHAS